MDSLVHHLFIDQWGKRKRQFYSEFISWVWTLKNFFNSLDLKFHRFYGCQLTSTICLLLSLPFSEEFSLFSASPDGLTVRSDKWPFVATVTFISFGIVTLGQETRSWTQLHKYNDQRDIRKKSGILIRKNPRDVKKFRKNNFAPKISIPGIRDIAFWIFQGIFKGFGFFLKKIRRLHPESWGFYILRIFSN